MLATVHVSYFIDPKRNAKPLIRKLRPRDTPPPTTDEIDYNKMWRPEHSDGYLGYKPWYLIDASEKFLDDVSATAAHYLL